jgi:Acetyltransferase (GNAT) family
MAMFERVASTASVGSAAFREVPPERSGTFRRHSSLRLTEEFWGLDLCSALPRTLTRDGVCAVPGELDRVRDFLSREYPSLTQEGLGVAPNARMLDAKHRYLNAACSLIEMRHGDRTVGVLVGAPEDWSTYYVRTFALTPEYQRPGLLRRFVRECLFEPLRAHNVERVTADTSPSNIAMSRTLSELHFYVTGHQLSERWGPLVRYTKFLDPACEAAFQTRFAGTAPPRSTDRKEEP